MHLLTCSILALALSTVSEPLLYSSTPAHTSRTSFMLNHPESLDRPRLRFHSCTFQDNIPFTPPVDLCHPVSESQRQKLYDGAPLRPDDVRIASPVPVPRATLQPAPHHGFIRFFFLHLANTVGSAILLVLAVLLAQCLGSLQGSIWTGILYLIRLISRWSLPNRGEHSSSQHLRVETEARRRAQILERSLNQQRPHPPLRKDLEGTAEFLVKLCRGFLAHAVS